MFGANYFASVYYGQAYPGGATDTVHTTDALLYTREVTGHTTDSYLQLGKWHTTDALIYERVSLDHTTDSFLFAAIETSHTTDALINRIVDISHTTDTLLGIRVTTIHTTDGMLYKRITKTHTTDTYIKPIQPVVPVMRARLDTARMRVKINPTSMSTKQIVNRVRIQTNTPKMRSNRQRPPRMGDSR